MIFSPNFWTTVLGSFPNQDGNALSERLVRTLNIPDWPQLPRRTFRENMYVQFSPSMPGIKEDQASGKVIFDTTGDLTPGWETFYDHFLAEDLEAFRLKPRICAGVFQPVGGYEVCFGFSISGKSMDKRPGHRPDKFWPNSNRSRFACKYL